MSAEEAYSIAVPALVLSIIALVAVIIIAIYVPVTSSSTVKFSGNGDTNVPNQLAIFPLTSSNNASRLVPKNVAGSSTEGFPFVDANGSTVIQPVNLADPSEVIGMLQPINVPIFTGNVGNISAMPLDLTIAPMAVNSSMIADGAVNTRNIADGAVTDQKGSLANKPLARLAYVPASPLTTVPSGLFTIDFVTPIAGDIILVAMSTASALNGPYVAQTGAWTRPSWYESTSPTQAMFADTLVVYDGTVYVGTRWYISSPAAGTPIVIDTTATIWKQVNTNPTVLTAPVEILGTNAKAFTVVDANNITNFQVNNKNDAPQPGPTGTGLAITTQPAGSGVGIGVLSTGTNENLGIDALGTGNILMMANSGGIVNSKKPVQIDWTSTTSPAALTVTNASSLTPASAPVLTVNAPATGYVTGLSVTSNLANQTPALGVNVAVQSKTSGGGTGNDPLFLDASGSGQIVLNKTATGTVLTYRDVLFDPATSHNIQFTQSPIPTTAVGLTISGASTTGTVGGAVTVQSGASATAGGGTLTLQTPNMTAGTTSGPLNISTGSAFSGSAGTLTMNTGSGAGGAGAGGTMSIFSGSGQAGGGPVSIQTGSGTTTGTGGQLTLAAGSGGTVSGAGGGVQVNAGNALSNSAAGGGITVTAGNGGTSNGSVAITAGSTLAGSTGAQGGGVTITSGTGAGTSPAGGGNIQLLAGAGSSTATLINGPGGSINIVCGNAQSGTSQGGSLTFGAGNGFGTGAGGSANLIAGSNATAGATGGAVSIQVGSGGLANGAMTIGTSVAPSSITIGSGITAATGTTFLNNATESKAVFTTSASTPVALTAGQSGAIINVVQQGVAIEYDLPAAAPGLYYEFVLTTAAAGTFLIKSAGAGGSMRGIINSSAGKAAVNVADVNKAAATGINFAGGTAIVSDWIRIRCVDGINWYATAQSTATAGIVFSP